MSPHQAEENKEQIEIDKVGEKHLQYWLLQVLVQNSQTLSRKNFTLEKLHGKFEILTGAKIRELLQYIIMYTIL